MKKLKDVGCVSVYFSDPRMYLHAHGVITGGLRVAMHRVRCASEHSPGTPCPLVTSVETLTPGLWGTLALQTACFSTSFVSEEFPLFEQRRSYSDNECI